MHKLGHCLGASLGDSVRSRIRDYAAIPDVEIPEGRWLTPPPPRAHLAHRARPGRRARPRIVLLHAVGCTGMLTWFPAVHELAKHYRVVVFDQRWHGRGIISENFSLHDCADDVAAVITELELDKPIVAGYSMGSVIAQRVWRQHPDLVGGLVLGGDDRPLPDQRPRASSSTPAWSSRWGRCARSSKSRTVRWASRSTAEALDIGPTDIGQWALSEWRSTSPWAVAQAVAAVGRHHSTPWLSRIDVPTAVVVPSRTGSSPPSASASWPPGSPERPCTRPTAATRAA